MRTLDEQNRRTFTWSARAARNLRLAYRLAAMVVTYFSTGARIRQAYREKERNRETYWLDEEIW